MTFEDRLDLVSIVEETHALIGTSLSFEFRPFTVVRPEIAELLHRPFPEPLIVDDDEMRFLMNDAFVELIKNVEQIQELLLREEGARFDARLQAAGLGGVQLAIKRRGFRRELQGTLTAETRRLRRRFFGRALKWGNIALGSLTSVPLVGLIAEPLKEFKECVEVQRDGEADG